MGLLDPADWKASWIEVPFELTPEMPPNLIPASIFRHEFSLEDPVTRAVLSVSALGIYEVNLNGKRVGTRALAPEWTDYHQRVQYQTYDVTDLVRSGSNTVCATVAEGWYAGRIGFWKEQGQYGSFRTRFLAQLSIFWSRRREDRNCHRRAMGGFDRRTDTVRRHSRWSDCRCDAFG